MKILLFFRQFYENWALLLDEEIASNLPVMARGGYIIS